MAEITGLAELSTQPTGPIFDTHAHYTSGSFNANRAELLAALPGMGVALVLDQATDLASAEASLALAEQIPWLYTAVGIHPESLIEDDASTVARFRGDWRAELAEIEKLLAHPKVVAVGEVGLDHHWPVPREAQLELFEAQILLAQKHGLPLSIHDREAHAEVYALLKKHRPRAVLHAYSGSAEDAAWLCGQGVYLGFAGPVTFKNAKRPREAAAAVPQDYLLLETDCPYMAPEPYRGRQCHSGLIVKTAEKIAEIRGSSTGEMLRLATANGKRLFAKIALYSPKQ